MKKTTIVAAVLIAGTAVTAFAHSGATGIVKERMDAMLAMGKAVKTVAPMMRGETAYDAETVRDAARLFQQHAGESMTKLVPEGTGGHALGSQGRGVDRLGALRGIGKSAGRIL